MNNPRELTNELVAEAFADYRKNLANRIDEGAEATAQSQGARVGVSRKHESAHLHVAGEAPNQPLPMCMASICSLSMSTWPCQ